MTRSRWIVAAVVVVAIGGAIAWWHSSGRESTDEMGSMTLLVTAPSEADGLALRAAQAQHFRQQLLKK